MSEKYDIPKFTETYRKVEHHQTLVLPILMILVVALCYLLVVYTKPTPNQPYGGNRSVLAPIDSGEEADFHSLAGNRPVIGLPPRLDLDFSSLDFDSATIDLTPHIDHSTTPPEPASEPTSIPKARVVPPQPAHTPNESAPEGPSIHPVLPTDNRYTDWMTPRELNGHILTLNQGFKKSFWDRGHWIVAVEGRLNRGVEEFRIVYEKAPAANNYGWRYRISQTRDNFAQTMRDLNKQNFQLIHSQAFTGIDNHPRYQAVWQRLP